MKKFRLVKYLQWAYSYKREFYETRIADIKKIKDSSFIPWYVRLDGCTEQEFDEQGFILEDDWIVEE